jgi:hypothetical protein
LAYQPPTSSTFLSQQTNHQQPANNTFFSEQTSTSHQLPANRTGSVSPTVRRPPCAASRHHLASSPSATDLQDGEFVAAASELLIDG